MSELDFSKSGIVQKSCQRCGKIFGCGAALNSCEYVWGKWKRYLLPNFCPAFFETLKYKTKRSLKKLKRRINPVQSF
ncbi:hypothetical protein [Leptospira santarosai]|uniref:hypothetical protein n=1 Tax=Leptospira santarosai TaxID=28183 RepID=UPI00069C47D6|nr:hypothetical protein [Leptospira santarosai]MDI7164459.1 hypothetical protein [Leptospira santarosai]OLY62829.1 hypothetical protein BWD11_18035 [Leptospira santarosai serovar Grippotyphosa]ONF79584.1 hypothetical protein BWD12_07680 [Leptospira santarosai serovar Bananal]ONF88895.1 hypothetical protein BWD13_00245 [Leptospira santarosai serovar Grippotyphosa]